MQDTTKAVHEGTTLVVGGTGKTGRRVAERLQARGLPVRIGSRVGRPPFDWHEPATWAPALDGVSAVYLTYYPDLALPGAAEAVAGVSRIAAGTGTRVVLLSGRGEPEARAAELALQDSGAEWTVVRASWFAQNFSESFLLDAVRAGVVALPADDVAEPFIDADDIADVAVAALTGAGHASRVYEVTGPRLLSFAEAVDEIGRACGRAIRYVPVTMGEFAAGLARQGVPEELAGLLRYLLGEVLDGRNAHLTAGVQGALGREPCDFADYARSTAASGAWSVAR